MNYKELLDIRKRKGMEIAQKFKIIKRDNEWIVPSQTFPSRHYIVKLKDNIPVCSCPDFKKRGIKCKHQFAVEIVVTKQMDEEGMTITKKITYSQEWHAYDKAQTQQKELFMKLLYELCKAIPQPEYRFGRPSLPLSDMIFSSALKVFTTFSLRRFITDIKTAKELGYVQTAPYYSTVARYMEKPELTEIIKKLIKISSLPLRSVETGFTIDSSGFSTSRFARWFDHKYGKEKDFRIWIKVHLFSGTKTNIVTSAEVTTSDEYDSKFLPNLAKDTVENFHVEEVSADKAYSSRNNLDVIEEIGAMPYIPFRKGTKPRAARSSMWHKMWYYFMYKHENFLQHYHKRSKAETVFHMIKSKFGDAVRSKKEVAEKNEILLKILCHNICVVIHEMHELGIEPEFFVAKV